jgi:Spy/CpxP family protein refolding chaperone
MARQITWAFAVLMFLATSGRAAELCEATQQRGGTSATAKPKGDKRAQDDKKPGAHQEPKWKWWIDPQHRAELAITDQQSALVEQVWVKSLPKLRELREQLLTLEAALSVLLAKDQGDDAAIAAQIDRVEAKRAEGNTARTLMIYRMHKVLNVDQRAKVMAMMERRDDRKDGGRRGGGSSSR